jgi:RNA polymerase sigma-70 factor (ECF subfamily)
MQKPWDIDLTIYDDEAALLAGLRLKERMACTCLLKRYAPRLYRLALQVTGETDEAEDVLQESFIRACERIDDFEGRSGLGTWLHRIVLNAALMRLRRKQQSVVSLDEQATGNESFSANMSLGEALSDETAGPGDNVLSLELREMINQALRELPESLRVAFVLRDIEGLSTREAATMLGISEPALKVRLHRARLALRSTLAPYIDQAEPRSQEHSDDG